MRPARVSESEPAWQTLHTGTAWPIRAPAVVSVRVSAVVQSIWAGRVLDARRADRTMERATETRTSPRTSETRKSESLLLWNELAMERVIRNTKGRPDLTWRFHCQLARARRRPRTAAQGGSLASATPHRDEGSPRRLPLSSP